MFSAWVVVDGSNAYHPALPWRRIGPLADITTPHPASGTPGGNRESSEKETQVAHD